MRFFSLDLETTGLDPGRDAIIEVAWVRFEGGKPRERFQSLVWAPVVPREVERLTGISAERLRAAPPLAEVLPRVLDRLAGEVVAAHNAPFDRAFLERAAERAGIEFPEIHWVDTLSLARAIWPERDSHALPSLRELLGLGPSGAHRALPDAEATGYLFLEELAAFPHLPGPTQELLLRWVPARARPLFEEALAAGPAPPRGRGILEEVFSLLAKKIPGFSLRPAQVAYAAWVRRALEEGGIYLLEAGAGTGKTYGYLVPLLVLLEDKRAVISTRTKALQDQLWRRDLPALKRALRSDVRVALLKGRENYLCLWQLERERGLFGQDLLRRVRERIAGPEPPEVGDLYPLLGGSPEGRALLERLRYSPHRCLGQACPFLRDCPPRAARRAAQEARIAVVNHSLLVSDFVAGGRVLGPYDCLVVDEAHALPKAFQEGLTRVFSPGEVARALEEVGSLPPELVPRTELRRAWRELRRARGRLEAVVPEEPAAYGRREGLRYLSAAQDLIWALVALQEAMQRLAPSATGEGRALLAGMAAAVGETVEAAEFVLGAADEGYVFWSERGPEPAFHAAPLEFAAELRDRFWSGLHCAILTSATLSVRGRADFLARELGLEAYTHRAFPGRDPALHAGAFVLRHMPHPDGAEFAAELARLVRELVERFSRKVLVLFTSRRALERAEALLEGVPGVVSQLREADAGQAVERFRRTGPPAVLLGLDSLWEGVDFPGEELEILVVTRLPFPNPADPLIHAKEHRLRERGLDPFVELYLPQAVIKLAQGTGRLLRTPEDRGAVIIADPRIVTKPYGEAFRAKLSLPVTEVSSPEELFLALREILG